MPRDETRYRWLFSVEGADDDDDGEVDASGGSRDSDIEFEGTRAEADTEGTRRADLWEKRTGQCCVRVVMARRGEVEAAAAGVKG